MTEKRLDMGRLLSRRFRVSRLDHPSENVCTLTITGTAEEVFRVSLWHAIDAHGHTDTPGLREIILASLTEVELHTA